MIFKIRSLFFKISFFTLLFLYRTNPLQAGVIDSLFRTDEIINMELRSDFSEIRRDQVEDPEYHDAKLIYHTREGNSVDLSVKIIVRGNFRRKPENCNFPPLYVNFKKNEVKNTLFDNQDKLKLVTPCQGEEDVLEEYMVYKMYNDVTDMSFKVRLVKISYFDTSFDQVIFDRYSFFIEDKDHVAERNNAVVRDNFLTPFDLNRESFEKLSVFQYIIGNKDWYISSRKNVVIMQPADTSLAPVAVPYDFDFAGVVDAGYTKPKGIASNLLPDRRNFKGICMPSETLNEIFDFYRELKPVFVSTINNQELLPNNKKKYMRNYINQFYSVINSKELIKQEFLNNCETMDDYNISAYKN